MIGQKEALVRPRLLLKPLKRKNHKRRISLFEKTVNSTQQKSKKSSNLLGRGWSATSERLKSRSLSRDNSRSEKKSSQPIDHIRAYINDSDAAGERLKDISLSRSSRAAGNVDDKYDGGVGPKRSLSRGARGEGNDRRRERSRGRHASQGRSSPTSGVDAAVPLNPSQTNILSLCHHSLYFFSEALPRRYVAKPGDRTNPANPRARCSDRSGDIHHRSINGSRDGRQQQRVRSVGGEPICLWYTRDC